MKTLFETAFVQAIKKHASLKKQIEIKVNQIIEHPVHLGEPLRGNFRGYYSCPVKRNFIIIYLYCAACRQKGDHRVVACSDCSSMPNDTIKFVLLGPHDEAYGKK